MISLMGGVLTSVFGAETSGTLLGKKNDSRTAKVAAATANRTFQSAVLNHSRSDFRGCCGLTGVDVAGFDV